jgi:hypothetical protein
MDGKPRYIDIDHLELKNVIILTLKCQIFVYYGLNQKKKYYRDENK